jgi:hypothetical protein
MNELSLCIHRNLEMLCLPGMVYELRALHTNKGTVSGYFDDLSKMAQAAAAWSGKAEGVYMTLNPVNPELLARANNRMREYSRHTSSDAEITKLTYLMIDFDPIRPTGISATDGEKAKALERLTHAVNIINANFDRRLFTMDSGNGYHLLLPLEYTDNTAEKVALCQTILNKIADGLSNEFVTVDRKTFNPARLTTCYGTQKCKGDATSERPHRFSGQLK